jgi:tripartite-type tricarboxylate transporter receptor subunit TctC
MRKSISGIVIAAILVGTGIAESQTYPSRPITMVVPFAAGGGADTTARIVAAHMRLQLGQQIIIENVAGANGSIGVGRVAHAAPDGYTLVVGTWNTHVANGAVYPLQYDLIADFEQGRRHQTGMISIAPAVTCLGHEAPRPTPDWYGPTSPAIGPE